MSGTDTSETAPAVETQGPDAPPAQPPVSADARAAAAARARKHRALKKLKSAKTEDQLKKVAAEVATDEPKKPEWPTKDQCVAAYGDVADLVGEYVAPELKGTRYELTERKAQVLCITLAPAVAQLKNAPPTDKFAALVPPWVVGLAGLAVVFGPPLFADLREAFGDKKPAPPVRLAPAPQPAKEVPDAPARTS